jgi:hypothetical protein
MENIRDDRLMNQYLKVVSMSQTIIDANYISLYIYTQTNDYSLFVSQQSYLEC